MAEEVARRASVALASARLFAAGEAALRRATALQRVTDALAGALSAEDVARVVVSHGRAAVNASAGALSLLDREGRQFEIMATEGYDEATNRAFARVPLVPGRPLSDAVSDGVARYFTSLAEAAVRYPDRIDAMRATGFEAMAVLPVRVGDERVAGLSFSFVDRREFLPEDRAFLETLAAQTGQALERARLVEAERTARAAAETARAEALAASRAKSEFLATMSHELRTPLNAIGGYVQLITLGIHGPVTDAQREALERVRQSERHLLGLINEVLNYTRLEIGAVSYDVRPTDVGEVVRSVLPLVDPQRAARGLRVELRLPGNGSRVEAMADREKLQQVLLNLLSNAIKLTEPGGAIVVEALPGGDAGGTVGVRVVDTGVGIPADKLEAIFEPFVQIGRALSNPGEGTGLGLAISRDLARGMGGDITVESGVARGSAFTVTLRRP